jgi:putative transposase
MTAPKIQELKDCPETRPIHPRTAGNVIAFPELGGLHHRYERRAA